MLGILADDPAHALPFAAPSDDEATVLADRCAGWANLHDADGEEATGAEDCGGGAPATSPFDVGAGDEADAGVMAPGVDGDEGRGAEVAAPGDAEVGENR